MIVQCPTYPVTRPRRWRRYFPPANVNAAHAPAGHGAATACRWRKSLPEAECAADDVPRRHAERGPRRPSARPVRRAYRAITPAVHPGPVGPAGQRQEHAGAGDEGAGRGARLGHRSAFAGRLLLRPQRTGSAGQGRASAAAQPRRARHPRDRVADVGAGCAAAGLGQAAGHPSRVSTRAAIPAFRHRAGRASPGRRSW